MYSILRTLDPDPAAAPAGVQDTADPRPLDPRPRPCSAAPAGVQYTADVVDELQGAAGAGTGGIGLGQVAGVLQPGTACGAASQAGGCSWQRGVRGAASRSGGWQAAVALQPGRGGTRGSLTGRRGGPGCRAINM